MAYQQRLPNDNPSRQHYDHQTASYAVPSPHSRGQRVSEPSERRFDHTRGYHYENGAHGAREYGQYNNTVQGYAWASSPQRQDWDQPFSYRPAQGEGQITRDTRYDRQQGSDPASGRDVENRNPGRRRGRGEGAVLGPVTRPVKSHQNEGAINVQSQQKLLKQSIIPEPTSPVSTAWDNPFPTFPTGRSKQKPSSDRNLSDRSRGLKSPGARENEGPVDGHQRNLRDQDSTGTGRSQHYLQHVVEREPRDHQDHFTHSNVNHRWGGQQANVESAAIIAGSAQDFVPSLPAKPAHGDRFAGQNQYYGRREKVPDQAENLYPGKPLPPVTASNGSSQRSMTLPGEFGALRLESGPRQNEPGSWEWQEPGPTGAYYGPDSRVIIPQRPATSWAQRSPERSLPGPDDAIHSYKCSVDGLARPEISKGRHREYSLGDVVDSYGVSTSTNPKKPLGGSERWPSLEDEMPNFDIVPTTGAEHSRDLTFEYYLPPQGSSSGSMTGHTSAVGGLELHQEPYSVEPVSQSIFQPDHGGPSQPLPDNSAGFLFELVGDEPAAPPGVTGRSDGRAQHLDKHRINMMSYRQHNDHPAQPYEQGMEPGVEASLAAGFLDDRSQNDWHPNARNQHVPPLPRQLETPALRRARASEPQFSSVSGHSPGSDPDTLPEHPTPVRPGLMQGVMSGQVPKPPPVRQYDNSPSPIEQNGYASQKTPSKASQQKGSFAPVTLDELVKLRQTIRANPKDQKTQLVLAKKLVQAASVLADEGGRADPKTTSKNREKYIFDAHKIIKKLVNSGNADAMFYLADCHGRGLLGLESDDKEAFTLYQSAAKAGHAQSAYRVAVCCEMGQEGGCGTRRDPLKAMQWYKKAAMLGDTPAMYKMGMILLKGLLGQSRNSREAIVWLKRAADRADEENPHALHELGLLYENASGNDHIIRDEQYSKQLFTQAAELGYKFSQFRLGCAYEYGLIGCAIDPRQSIAWYSRAAIQGEHQSELALSGWYLTGSEGVLQQSDTEAYLWARKAAHAGLAKAEYAMGYFTEVGIGAPANIEDAKRWYWRAASQNFPKARERLEDLRKGGAKMQKSRVSRSTVNKQSEGDCVVM